MKAVFAFLLAIIFPIGIWTAFVVHSRLPFMPSSDEEMEAPFLTAETPNVHWVSGIVRSINPMTGAVLLQTEKGTEWLFAPPQVVRSLTEGKTVSAYIAANKLDATVAI
jgi:hypothetical protein